MSIVNANMTTMRVCRIFGVPALFTPHRVSRQTVHFGLYQYDMQALLDSPNEVFVLAEQAEDLFYGTILTTRRIDLPRGSRIVPNGAFTMEARYCSRPNLSRNMEQHKFYQPDILSCLTEIVQKNTRAYTTDFDFDAKRLWDSAQESDMERRSFLWMCRPLGTWCVLEREVFLDDTNANCIWTHYADCPEGILAYRIVIEGIHDGKLAGRVIPIDYAKQVQRVIKSALPVAIIQYRDKDEYFCENSFHAFMNSPLPFDDGIHDIRYVPESEAELQHILMLEHRMEQKTKRSCRTKSTAPQR